MKINRKIIILLLGIISLLAITGCGGDEKLSDFVAISAEEPYKIVFTEVCKKYFKGVVEYNEDGEYGDNDPKYILFISSDESILNREQVDGKYYTVLIHYDGSEEVDLKIMYSVGTTENCVKEGNATMGKINMTDEFTYTFFKDDEEIRAEALIQLIVLRTDGEKK
ncbi:MAG: hypothetical protein GXZ11_09270 [Tissierellia bacterium]|nr:hypothetical protein [Tissierellia bacterium]